MRSALIVIDVTPEEYPAIISDEGIYHIYDYQFFCRNLQKNAEARMTAYQNKQAIEHRDVSKDLLLVVDFQNVYLPEYDWSCPTMPEAMKNTIRLLDAPNAPDYIMTKFLAPAEPVGRWQQYNEAFRAINENAFLAEFPKELAPYAAKAPVVEKSTYSSMKAEQVLAALKGKEAVVLTGVTAECCVLATMMDAMDLGYEVVYLYDCIAGQSAELNAEIQGLAKIYTPVHTTVMSCDEYLASIS